MEYPPVVVMIVTYERRDLALRTIRSVKERLIYPNIGFHIADDGSREGHIQALKDEIGGSYSVTVTNSQRGGVGRSMNMGTVASLSRANLILHLEDDWIIPEGQTLELAPFVELLMTESSIGMVRLGQLTLDMQGVTVNLAKRLYWKLHKGPPYTFNGNPSLRHRRFCEVYGRYREGLMPGETEVAMCWQFNNTKGPDIVIPPWIQANAFKHIGDHQSFKYFMEREGLTAAQAAARFDAMG